MEFAQKVINKLEAHDVRKTAVRKQVLSLFLEEEGKALSNSDIEEQLEAIDRITLYRTLRTFEEKGLIHQAVDSTGTNKYALCLSDCTTHHHEDRHAHFQCNTCGETTCLESKIPASYEVPSGYEIQQAHLVLEGTCIKCNVEK